MLARHDPLQRRRPWHKWGPAVICVARSKTRSMGFPSLWSLRCQQVRKWIGHLARAPHDNPVAEIDWWRPPLWWHTCQTLHGPPGWPDGATNWARARGSADCIAADRACVGWRQCCAG